MAKRDTYCDMLGMIQHWRWLWRERLFWRLLWLTVRYPRTPKHLWSTHRGYEVRAHAIPEGMRHVHG
jgi:hypothetical protein